MNHTLLVVMLGLCSVTGLVLIALGLPGIWLIVAAVVGGGALTGFHAIGWGTIAIAVALALLGELFELWFGFGLARRYGDRSGRAGARSSAVWSAPSSAFPCRSSGASSVGSS